MCKESIVKMMKGMSSPNEVVSLRILDPAVGSGAFLAQAYRSILNQSLVQGIALDDDHKSLLISDVLHGVMLIRLRPKSASS
jgi:type I restriction-modification system DNA methylase subunit